METKKATEAATKKIPVFINGRAFESTARRWGPVYNPATGQETHRVPLGGAEDVASAVAAARAAFPAWRATSLARRTAIMFQIRQQLADHQEDLARTVTREHGKVLADAMGEVARGLENVEFACGIPQLLKGEYTEQASTDVDVYSIRQPLGVVAGVTPFNFPAMVPLWMLSNAIAAGNTFVLKPSEKDPSASVLLATLLSEAGLPPGVFNVVHGDREAVEALAAHPDVSAVSVVGSTPVARAIRRAAVAADKRVQALGGAKNHLVVLADADVEAAADGAVSAAFGSAGERCMAVSVVVAVDDIADALVAAIVARTRALRIGDGLDPASDMGPLVTREHRDRVAGYIEAGRRDGAAVVVDGREAPACEGPGFFLGATLLDHVTPSMACYRDEIFGPVLCVVRVHTLDDALALVNDSPWGNGVALYTRDGGAARRFQFEVLCGMVGINVPIPVPVGYHSFGGWKASLFGDTHIYGPDGVNFYTRRKVVTSRWPRAAADGVDLRFPGSE